MYFEHTKYGILKNNLYTFERGQLFPFIQLDIGLTDQFGFHIGASRTVKGEKQLWIPLVLTANSVLENSIINNFPWCSFNYENIVQTNVDIFKYLSFGYFTDVPDDYYYDDVDGFAAFDLYSLFDSNMNNVQPFYAKDTNYNILDFIFIKVYKECKDNIITQGDVFDVITMEKTTNYKLKTKNDVISDSYYSEHLFAMTANSSIKVKTTDHQQIFDPSQFDSIRTQPVYYNISVDDKLEVSTALVAVKDF